MISSSARSAGEARQDAIRAFCATALHGLDALEPEGRRRLPGTLIDEIVVWGDVIEIRGVLPPQSARVASETVSGVPTLSLTPFQSKLMKSAFDE